MKLLQAIFVSGFLLLVQPVISMAQPSIGGILPGGLPTAETPTCSAVVNPQRNGCVVKEDRCGAGAIAQASPKDLNDLFYVESCECSCCSVKLISETIVGQVVCEWDIYCDGIKNEEAHGEGMCDKVETKWSCGLPTEITFFPKPRPTLGKNCSIEAYPPPPAITPNPNPRTGDSETPEQFCKRTCEEITFDPDAYKKCYAGCLSAFYPKLS